MADRKALVLTTITDEHLVPLEILCERLQTNIKNGIPEKEAKRLLQEKGKNKFKLPPRRKLSHDWQKLNFGGKKDDFFTKTEWKKLFGQCIPDETTVIREGRKKKIYGKHVVMGDLVVLRQGNFVPADIRIIYSENVKVDNRLITSNRSEIRTHLNDYVHQDCLLSSNMLYACTKLLSGFCVGVVLRTGDETVFGTLKDYATKVKFLSTRRKSSVETFFEDTY